MTKTIRIVLILIFVMGLYAGGVFADTACNAKCCFQTNPDGMHHAAGERITSSVNCHSNIPAIPCDLQSKQIVELPEYTLGAAGGNFSNTAGTARIISDSGIDNHNFERNYFDQTVWVKSQSPPIYLHNVSFQI
jgi:hypothetical protein